LFIEALICAALRVVQEKFHCILPCRPQRMQVPVQQKCFLHLINI